jgi:hypothetical protein
MTKIRLYILGIFFLLILIIPGIGFAQGTTPVCDPGGAVSQGKLCNAVSGASDLTEFFNKGLVVFAAFTTVIPIMAVVFSGLLMMLSQGNQESLTRAKSTFQWTVLGFILSVSAFFIVSASIAVLGADQIPDARFPDDKFIVNPLTIFSPNGPITDNEEFGNFLKGFLNNVLGFVSSIALLMLIVNGFRYIISSGNEEQSKQAKEGLKWAIAGIVTVLFAFVIIRATANLLGLP